MRDPGSSIAISVIVPVGQRHADARPLIAEYEAGLDALGQDYELIFVLDGPNPKFSDALRQLIAEGKTFTVVSLTREFGEATALMAGFEQAKRPDDRHPARLLPDRRDRNRPSRRGCREPTTWPSAGAGRGPAASSKGCVAARSTACSVFSPASSTTTWAAARAPSTGACWRKYSSTATTIDSSHCLPTGRVSASRRSPSGSARKIVAKRAMSSASTCARCSISFRSSSSCDSRRSRCGSSVWSVPAPSRSAPCWSPGWSSKRLFFGVGLADRPALLLSSLLVVLGLELFALGLLGELIIFTHARQIRDYQIGSVIRFSQGTRVERPDRSPGPSK